MKNLNSFGVLFTVRKKINENGKAPVYARISVNGSRVEISMKCWILPDDWQFGNGKAKPKTNELRELNTHLEQIRSQITTHFRHLQLTGDLLTAEMVKNAFLGISKEDILKEKLKKSPEKTLLWLVAEHNKRMAHVLQPGSLKNYYSTERYLQKFLSDKYPKADINLKDLNFSFINDFSYYIQTTPLKTNDPCTNNGLMKHMERIKKMATWAFHNEWMEKDPFINYKLKFKHKLREALTESELDLIKNMEFHNELITRVCDMFIFSCYTGLSYIDLADLRVGNIVAEKKDLYWIKTARAKTNIAVDVPLLAPALAIVQKYYDGKDTDPRRTIFPYLTNQVMNRNLKVIGLACKINKDISFHLARHTFATTITLSNGVPIESISKMLGHTKIATTMIYAKVVQNKIALDMAALQLKLNKLVDEKRSEPMLKRFM